MSRAQTALKRAEIAMAKASGALGRERAHRRILCSCGKRHAIRELNLRITHWYVEPHGCTDGDYWKEGEWQFRCPTSDKINRLMFDDYGVDYEKRDTIGVAGEPTFKSIYRSLFLTRLDVYDKDDREPFYNNCYVDEHRKAFELPPKEKR